MAAKNGIKWNSERILSLSAMSISFITLIIFIYQTNLMSRQNDLSILPYLQVSESVDGETNSFMISLRNHGVGPAILESVIIEYDGERYDVKDYNDNLISLLASLATELDSLKYYSMSTLDVGIAIPANTIYEIVSVSNSAEDYELLTEALYKLENSGLRYEITYKSIQNERWIIHNDSEGPQKLD